MGFRIDKERVLYPLVSGLLVAALVLTVWALALRERRSKHTVLEFEAHRTITALVELSRFAEPTGDDLRLVVGFGLYDAQGAFLYGSGSAPDSLDPAAVDQQQGGFSIGADSVTMVRALGGDLPGRRMSGMMGFRTRRPAGDEALYAFLEYGLGTYRAEQAVILGSAVLATLALVVLYAVILRLFKRFSAYRDREARDRELVELGQAARTIAHEIKNPLGIIRIQCGILRKDVDRSRAPNVRVIEDEVDRLAAMADRIREYLRREPGPQEPVALSGFLTGLAERYGGKVVFRDELDPAASVLADPDALRAALDNLITNAEDARMRAGSDEAPFVVSRQHRGRLVVDVLDRGNGIAPEHRSRIFEPFYTTKEKGSGLGLALARKNVESMGGTLAYADRPGGGAVFTVSLPAANVPGDAPSTASG